MANTSGELDKPTKFARFFLRYAVKNNISGTLIDLGCGNGRDTRYLSQRFVAQGIDYLLGSDVMQSLPLNADVVYSRFFLHCIKPFEVLGIISNTPKYFVAECRAEGDVPILYKHHRYFVNPEWLLTELICNKFEILFFEKGRGMAEYKNENPLVLRVISRRM